MKQKNFDLTEDLMIEEYTSEHDIVDDDEEEDEDTVSGVRGKLAGLFSRKKKNTDDDYEDEEEDEDEEENASQNTVTNILQSKLPFLAGVLDKRKTKTVPESGKPKRFEVKPIHVLIIVGLLAFVLFDESDFQGRLLNQKLLNLI